MSKIIENDSKILLPAMPLRGLVLFPETMLYLDIGRKKSVSALNESMNNDQLIFIVSQKSMKDDDPKTNQLYKVGVVAQVKQIMRQPGSVIKVLVEGLYRAKVEEYDDSLGYIQANIIKCEDIVPKSSKKCDALIRKTKEIFDEYLNLSPKVAPDIVISVKSSNEPGKLADYIATNVIVDIDAKLAVLLEENPLKRLEKVITLLSKEIYILTIEDEINAKLKEKIEKNQREYYLRENMKVIAEELGESDNPLQESEELKSQIEALKLPEEIAEKLIKECNRMSKMPPGSHEANVIRTYVEACLLLPWTKFTKENINLNKAQKILDDDHYGLKKVKERIVETLAVRKLNPDIKGQIICLVGPPGVGKTSIAKSIARSIGRKYARVALGGIKDESEIRGHRRTYIGAMPGRIIEAIKQAGTRNPLILLDEVDKLCSGVNGDPTSALLEVLDSEQNNSFYDHYIDMPFDLSDVLFITTANDYSSIPAPLIDRMEVIMLSSYTYEEKFNIAKKHLVPKQLKNHGISPKNVKITDKALRCIIECYTRESGVRTLERLIASVLRKSAKTIVSENQEKLTIGCKEVESMLGPKKFKNDFISKDNVVGLTNGLAWTSVGGKILSIEAILMPGKGKIELTGSLGDVMKESAQIAVSYIRSKAEKLGIDPEFYKKYDIHIHAPEGAIPKDGPSAGVTMVTSIVSALTNIPVKSDVAMTGEITLHGKVLPIGGLKEKTMAAYRSGVKTVIIPLKNDPDLAEVDDIVKNSIKFITADNLDTVLKYALDQNEKIVEISSEKASIAGKISNKVNVDCVVMPEA